MATTSIVQEPDYSALLELNEVYIRSVQTSDVARFQDILAEEFLCARPDGSLIDKAKFLDYVSHAQPFSNLKAHDVRVHLLGDVAIIHARTTFTGPDGRIGSSRYTDVWARQHGRWQAVSAHVTRY